MVLGKFILCGVAGGLASEGLAIRRVSEHLTSGAKAPRSRDADAGLKARSTVSWMRKGLP